MPAGRPTDYTPELGDQICARMSHGESIRRITQADDMPDSSTVYRWLRLHEEFRENYEEASINRAHLIAEESLEIADDATNDYMERRSEAEKGAGWVNGWVLNGEHVQRSRLRVDTRKWFASKLAPKKYGEKVQQEITGKDGGPVQTEVGLRPSIDRETWLALHGNKQIK